MNLRKLAALLLALLLFALPALAETAGDEAEAAGDEAEAAGDNADAIFMPAVMSEIYNDSIASVFAGNQSVPVDELADAMRIQFLTVSEGTLFYCTADGNLSLLFEGTDPHVAVPRVKAVSSYAEGGREVPLFPFFFAVSALSGDMDFFAWAMGEHENALEIYTSEKFNAAYSTSSENISVQISAVK